MGNDKREWKRDEGRAAGRLEVLTHSSEISATVAAISKQADAHTESEKEKKGENPRKAFTVLVHMDGLRVQVHSSKEPSSIGRVTKECLTLQPNNQRNRL